MPTYTRRLSQSNWPKILRKRRNNDNLMNHMNGPYKISFASVNYTKLLDCDFGYSIQEGNLPVSVLLIDPRFYDPIRGYHKRQGEQLPHVNEGDSARLSAGAYLSALSRCMSIRPSGNLIRKQAPTGSMYIIQMRTGKLLSNS